MARPYPIGIQDFKNIIDYNFCYVDKTEFVYELAKAPGRYFLSRPRRFGKSMLLSTLQYYFEGHRELFKGLKIDALEKDWTVRPVLHYTFTGAEYGTEAGLRNAIEVFLHTYEDMYGRSDTAESYGKRIETILKNAYEKTGQQAVILIDEYDKPLLDVFGTEMDATYREILSSLYNGIKNADKYEFFVLVTGVTKFSQVSLFCGANQLNDISMTDKYSAICGVTPEELHEIFSDGIKAMAEKTHITAQEVTNILKEMYDGYHFSPNSKDIYNPYGLVNCFYRLEFGSFWFQTSTPSALVEAMPGDSAMQIEEWTSMFFPAQRFAEYKASKIDILPLLYQSGYLTIKEVDNAIRNTKFRLDFPNDEVRSGFASVLFGHYTSGRMDGVSWMSNLQDAVRDGDIMKIRDLFVSYFASVPYSLHPVNSADSLAADKPMERFFHYTMFLIFNLSTGYLNIAEKQNAKGRTDFIVETDNYVYIFEFKVDRTANAALKQIAESGYAEPYLASGKKIFKIGVRFDSATGTIREWKEGEPKIRTARKTKA